MRRRCEPRLPLEPQVTLDSHQAGRFAIICDLRHEDAAIRDLSRDPTVPVARLGHHQAGLGRASDAEREAVVGTAAGCFGRGTADSRGADHAHSGGLRRPRTGARWSTVTSDLPERRPTATSARPAGASRSLASSPTSFGPAGGEPKGRSPGGLPASAVARGSRGAPALRPSARRHEDPGPRWLIPRSTSQPDATSGASGPLREAWPCRGVQPRLRPGFTSQSGQLTPRRRRISWN